VSTFSMMSNWLYVSDAHSGIHNRWTWRWWQNLKTPSCIYKHKSLFTLKLVNYKINFTNQSCLLYHLPDFFPKREP
jgi:hypothetical protein